MITLRPGSHVWRLLLLLAICGEYPYRSLHLLGSVRTLEELVRRLEVVQHFRTPAAYQADGMAGREKRGNRTVYGCIYRALLRQDGNPFSQKS